MFTAPPSRASQNLRSFFEPLSFKPCDPMHQLTPSPSKNDDLASPWPKRQPEIEKPKTEQVYVHPLVKSHSLSPKSLEMCTESLGNETGNDIISDSDAFSYHAFEKQSPCRINNPAKKLEARKKTKRVCNFPPPLTSISGSEGVQVQAHREGGRLVIKAFSFSYCRNYFQAERENGRLRLSLFRDCENKDASSVENEQHEEEKAEGVESDKADEGEKVTCGDESDDEADFNGRCYWGEDSARDDGERIGCKINGGDWPGAVGRCNGDRSGRSKSSRLPSLPFCVAT